MNVKIISLILTVLLLTTGTVLTQTGCNDNGKSDWDYGVTGGDSNYHTLTIAEILSDNENYTGEIVSVEGRISMVCPTAGCWIFIEDKGNSLFIQFYDFTVDLSNNTPVRILGEIRMRDGQPYIYARGLKVL